MQTEEKYDKEWKVITEKLEKDKVKRIVGSIMMVFSSRGVLHEKA
jgi:hypothetical protein